VSIPSPDSNVSIPSPNSYCEFSLTRQIQTKPNWVKQNETKQNMKSNWFKVSNKIKQYMDSISPRTNWEETNKIYSPNPYLLPKTVTTWNIKLWETTYGSYQTSITPSEFNKTQSISEWTTCVFLFLYYTKFQHSDKSNTFPNFWKLSIGSNKQFKVDQTML
jgi:hypothetical protein